MFSWIAQGFANVVNALTSLLNFFNPLHEDFFIKGILDFLFDILNYLNPLSENFFGLKLVDLIGELFTNLFIPDEDSFKQLTNVFEEKFAFIDSIKIAVESIGNIINNNISTKNYLSYEVDTPVFEGELFISFSWFEKFKPYTDLFLTGFVYLSFVWRLYRRLPSIISGFSE